MKEELLIMGTGDLVLDEPGPMEQYFEPAAQITRSADVLVGQVETPHTDRPIPSSTDYQAPPSKPEHLDALPQYGFNVATLAGNHIFDCGVYGVTDTYDRLKSLGVEPVGAGKDLATAKAPAFVEKNGFKVGVIDYNAVGPEFSYATTQKAGCNYIRVYTHFEMIGATPGASFPPKIFTFVDPEDELMMKNEIAALKKQCDIAIVCFHKGNYLEGGACQLEMYERPLAQTAVDAGADIVFSHHAHQPRGVEIYKGKPIYHGLGNFVTVTYALTPGYSDSPENDAFAEIDGWCPEFPHFPWENEDRFSAIARIKVVRGEDGEITFEEIGFVPCYIDRDTTAITPRMQDGMISCSLAEAADMKNVFAADYDCVTGEDIMNCFCKLNKAEGLQTRLEWSKDGTWIRCEQDVY